MQLLDLVPFELGVRIGGIYIVDNDERQILAGPFTHTADALTLRPRPAPRRSHWRQHQAAPKPRRHPPARPDDAETPWHAAAGFPV